MACKATFVAVAILTCLAFAQADGLRSLKQSWNCDAAKALNADNCKLLCTCVAQRNPAAPACEVPCNACATAAAACAPGAALPPACARYSTEPDIIACIGGAAGRRLL